ncbi:biotin--[acetyl-CoA-carboxylase] ligase [Microlunatus parietis]|uniref:biotin--[biotin carboxyl-carrier protein] ligase n=1 Tax=Microlunatus parietis TaxID=682979 RepID=A0A7Y9LEG8_9ACTN|nr:biotin--[acetyl-CoA-carboxylase] ligase [Microlunatus parietis]NYE73828.1 BirA family biotin operon repressor/biotin-[acetyl-CoA-carboxylase] ligase [Microlunatus parietis]
MPYDEPLDAAELRAALTGPGSLWRDVQLIDETGSTNTDLAAQARAGAPSGTVLIAEHQTAARGRLGRSWTAPPGTAIALSLLVRPEVPAARWTWLPLLTGIAVSESLQRAAKVPADLKWPNDVLVRDRKLCGILAERVEPAGGAETAGCVIGIGINVGLTEEQLPVPTATSLRLQPDAAPVGRSTMIITVLRAFALLYAEWRESVDDTALAAAYLARCGTVGRRVRVTLPGAEDVVGEAEAIDADGRLVVRTEAGRRAFGAGDIVHLR